MGGAVSDDRIVSSFRPTILTIGHSNLEIQAFIGHLRRHSVDVLVDIRSQPLSQMYHWFNKGTLTRWLESSGIQYVYLGDRLGGRPRERSLYLADGRADYVKIARTTAMA